MDRNTLFDSLVAWVNTFDLKGQKCETANDFKDGIVIAKCLNNIDPEYFNDDWVGKIKSDTNENWRLKLLNLKKILQTITDYYSEVLNHSLSGFEMPNLNLIAESTDSAAYEVTVELSHLLQLVLGCAVNCERKSDFIRNIMEMNETTQIMIMNAIQELMAKDRNSAAMKSMPLGNSNEEDVNFQLKKALSDLSRINEQKEDIDQKCKRLDKQISTLLDEKLALTSEIEMLKEKLQNQDNYRNDSNNDINKNLKLQQKLDQMQVELYKLESEKEKYRVQFEAAKADQKNLIEKNIELKKLAHDAQVLKDEIDVLKHTSDKVEKLESTIEMYKIKLEEMADLKQQMKQLQENNAGYLEQIVQMEKEVKKIGTLKSQIEMYKKQIQELHEQVLGGEMKIKTLEYEYKGVEESCTNLRQEKQRLQGELDRLKDSYEQLQMNAHVLKSTSEVAATDDDSRDPSLDGLFSSVELLTIPPETKEKILRLFHENKLLKTKQNDLNDERLVLIQTQYEDEKQRNGDLQSKLNETSKQKIELECQLNDLKKKDYENNNYLNNMEQQASQLKAKDDLVGELKTKCAKLQSVLDEETSKNEAKLKQLEAKVNLLNLENEKLVDITSKDKDELQVKIKELQEAHELNERYRSYLEKAKYVIQNLNPNGNVVDASAEVQSLRAQLAEKEKTIKQLMKEKEKIQSSNELEERLIAASWYQLGADLNRRATDERINAMGSSFLAQQRHIPSSASSSSLAGSASKRNNQINSNSSMLSTSNSQSSKLNATATIS